MSPRVRHHASSPSLVRQGLWGVLNTAVIRGSTLVFQLVLAGLLSAGDFGVYAIAIAIAGVAQTFRGAGVVHWQIQGGERQHHRRAANAFWIALMANVLLGLSLMALARPIGHVLSQPEVPSLVLVIGATLPFLTSGSYFQTRLQIQLRIRELTVIELASTLLRGGLMILFAVLGLGPLSFVLPNLPCYLLEHVMGYHFVRETPWRWRATFAEWPSILRSTRWTVLATLGLTVGLQADYITLGAFATAATIGYYYFAYQLTFQSAGIVSSNINRLLTSALVARSHEFDPHLFSRATRIIMMVGAPAVLMLATVMAPLERLLWHGKWSQSTTVVSILSLALPVFLLATVVTSALVSSGKFRAWAGLNLLKAVAVVALAVTAGLVAPDSPLTIAVIMTSGLCLVHTLQAVLGLRLQGLSLRQVFQDAGYAIGVGPPLALGTGWALGHLDIPDALALLAAPPVFIVVFAFGWAVVHRTTAAALIRQIRSGNRTRQMHS